MDERYDLVSGIDTESYLNLRREVYWAELPFEQAQNGLDNSFSIITARLNGQIVGMARMLWDGGYCAYLSDVIVSYDHRHQGLATEMINRLIAELKSALKPGWQVKVVLLAAKGKEDFYARFGFQHRPSERFGAGMDMWLKG